MSLLTVTTTADPATDLGFLLHKHPDKVQSFDVGVGRAHVFFPEASPQRCTAALLLEVDPIDLVRSGRFGGQDAFSLAQYVNDRPDAASSMLAVALGRVFSTARKGVCTARPELAATPIPLEIHVPSLPCRGPGEAERFFAPLGWQVHATPIPLDPQVADWGDSRYVDLHLSGTLRLAEALSHLYVLLPALDGTKHYWVGPEEVDKLVREGTGWLGSHPAREAIAARYLAHRRAWVAEAVDRLLAADDVAPEGEDLAEVEGREAQAGPDPTPDGEVPGPRPDAEPAGSTPGDPAPSAAEGGAEGPVVPLREVRLEAVCEALRTAGARRIVDLGCGEGALIRRLLREEWARRIVGVDVSARALRRAAERLHLDRATESLQQRVELIHSALTYVDARIAGFDAAVLMEVLEHLDPERLPDATEAVLGRARPGTLVVTTPNAEYNAHWDLQGMRHPDHRFEWTREQFADWARHSAHTYGYTVRLEPVGPLDPELGSPTQMAVFTAAGDRSATS